MGGWGGSVITITIIIIVMIVIIIIIGINSLESCYPVNLDK